MYVNQQVNPACIKVIARAVLCNKLETIMQENYKKVLYNNSIIQKRMRKAKVMTQERAGYKGEGL